MTLCVFFFLRYRPLTFHVQSWYDEVRDFSYPYPQECNPYCPYRCSGPVCTHYTQVRAFISQVIFIFFFKKKEIKTKLIKIIFIQGHF